MSISSSRGYTKPEATEAELSKLYLVGENATGARKAAVSDIKPGVFDGSASGLVAAPSSESSLLGSDGSWVGVTPIDKAFIDGMDWSTEEGVTILGLSILSSR